MGDLVSQEQLNDPATEYVMYISNVQLVQRAVRTKNTETDLLNPFVYSMHSTAQGPVLLRAALPYILRNPIGPYAIWKWQGLETFHVPEGVGIRMRERFCGQWRPSAVGFRR